MTYNVGDRVSYKGDKGTVVSAQASIRWPYEVEFDEGGSTVFSEEELEAAE